MTRTPATRDRLLLIGYGNPLRGDDGVGPRIVRRFARRHGGLVRACVVLQLVPELCALLAEHDAAIFVDASAAWDGGCRLLPLEGAAAATWGTHVCSPAALVALTAVLYEANPRAWCLAVAGQDFRLGAPLSAAARAGCREAVTILEAFVRSPRCGKDESCW
jgi:hydrogenase maturation protease